MQTLTWSDLDLKKEFADCKDLSEIIQQLEEKIWEQGEVICEVHVNDIFLSENDEERFAKEKIEDIQKLIVLSRKPEELISESLTSAIDLFPKVKSGAVTIADEFRNHGEQASKRSFVELLDACQWISESLFLLKSMLIQKVGKSEFEERWKSIEVLFARVAQDSLKAYDAKDYVLLSDILEYDLTESLDQWYNLLQSQSEIKKLTS